MKQYIDKSAIVAEIERRKKELIELSNDFANQWACGSLDDILSFLDTLEVKEVNNVWHDARRTITEDGSEQIICIKEDGLAVSTIGKIVNGTIKWAYLNDLLNISDIQVKEVNLKKELSYEDYIRFFEEHPNFPDDWGFDECWVFAEYFYKLGLKAQKGE